MLGEFDEGMLAALGREDAPADLRWLGGAPIPSYEEGNRVLLHPVFARYTIAQIPASQRRTRALRAAAVLRASGLVRRAFDLKRRYAPDSVLAELQTEGVALLDAGCWDGVEEAVRALPQSVRRDDAIVVCLRAELEAQAGALDRANVHYDRAYGIVTTPEVHARICRHRALHYLNAQYVLEVERGRRERALAIESEIPMHSGFGDELGCCVALGLNGAAPYSVPPSRCLQVAPAYRNSPRRPLAPSRVRSWPGISRPSSKG